MPSLLSDSSSLSLLSASSSLSRLSASSVSSLLSASSVPSWECQVSIFSPAWHSIIGLVHEVLLPLLDPIECLPVLDVDPSPVQCALFSPCCSIVLHSGLLIGKMLWSISLCLGSHGSYICSSLILVHLFVLLPQGVSPSIYSLQLCFPFAAGRFSINSG